MKSLKLISLAFSMLVCFVMTAQEKTLSKKHLENSSVAIEMTSQTLTKSKDTISNVKVSSNFVQPATPTPRIVVCAPSLNHKNEPLYILDGVLSNSKQLAKINPNDIEEIKILKGTDATSLYGNQAINGVVIITTKE